MDGTCGSYALPFAGGESGKVCVKKEGMFLVFEAELPECSSDAAVYAECGGLKKEIGRVTPRTGGSAHMKKRMSPAALKAAGIEGIEKIESFSASCDAPAPYPAPPPTVEESMDETWQPCADPGALFSDQDARESCRGVQGALTSRDGAGIVKLALPLEFGKPFLPMPIFTYGSWKKIDGRGYLVFSIRGGRPVI